MNFVYSKCSSLNSSSVSVSGREWKGQYCADLLAIRDLCFGNNYDINVVHWHLI